MSERAELFQGLQLGLQSSAGGRSPRRCLHPDVLEVSSTDTCHGERKKSHRNIERKRHKKRESYVIFHRWHLKMDHSTLVSFTSPRAFPQVTSVTYDLSLSSGRKSCCRSSLPHTYFWSKKKRTLLSERPWSNTRVVNSLQSLQNDFKDCSNFGRSLWNVFMEASLHIAILNFFFSEFHDVNSQLVIKSEFQDINFITRNC